MTDEEDVPSSPTPAPRPPKAKQSVTTKVKSIRFQEPTPPATQAPTSSQAPMAQPTPKDNVLTGTSNLPALPTLEGPPPQPGAGSTTEDWERYCELLEDWQRKRKVQERLRCLLGPSETNLTSSFEAMDVGVPASEPPSQPVPQPPSQPPSQPQGQPAPAPQQAPQQAPQPEQPENNEGEDGKDDDEEDIFVGRVIPIPIRRLVYNDHEYEKGLRAVSKLVPTSPRRMKDLEEKKAKNVDITSDQTTLLRTATFKLAFHLYFHCVAPPLLDLRQVEFGLREIWNIVGAKENDFTGCWDRAVSYKLQRKMGEERSKVLNKAKTCLRELFNLKDRPASYYRTDLRFTVAPNFYEVGT